MKIDFLKVLEDVLENIILIGRKYERNKIDEITPQYG